MSTLLVVEFTTLQDQLQAIKEEKTFISKIYVVLLNWNIYYGEVSQKIKDIKDSLSYLHCECRATVDTEKIHQLVQ